MKAPSQSPTMNTARHSTSEPFRDSRPPTMPLIPAILPFNRISSTADRPISNPPMNPLTGVKFSTIASFPPLVLHLTCSLRARHDSIFTQVPRRGILGSSHPRCCIAPARYGESFPYRRRLIARKVHYGVVQRQLVLASRGV